jgi:hypothetical protein
LKYLYQGTIDFRKSGYKIGPNKYQGTIDFRKSGYKIGPNKVKK